MIQQKVKQFISRHHFWRDIGFDELSQLYTSMMFRHLALSLVGIFIPIYLHTLGYSLTSIMSFFGFFFSARIGLDFIGAFLVARFGPKHIIGLSYGLQVVALLMLTSLKQFHWPLLLVAIALGAAQSWFFVAYHVDFSKIKHSKHGGKELGFMALMERGGSLLGPLVGGIIATVFAPQYTFLTAAICFGLALFPLLLSPEPVVTRQKLDFKGLPVRPLTRDLVSYSAITLENQLCIMLWPLFIALFIVSTDVYVKVGLLSSLGVLVAIVSAQAIGRYIDTRSGRSLLRVSVLINTGLHLLRPFTGNFLGALALNLANELVTVGYRIPYTKGFYDAADDLPGHRIVYIASMEAFGNTTKAVVYWILCISSTLLSTRLTLTMAFVFGAIASMLIMTERFKALRPEPKYAV